MAVSVIGSPINVIIVSATSAGSSCSEFAWPSTLVGVGMDVDVEGDENGVEGLM